MLDGPKILKIFGEGVPTKSKAALLWGPMFYTTGLAWKHPINEKKSTYYLT